MQTEPLGRDRVHEEKSGRGEHTPATSSSEVNWIKAVRPAVSTVVGGMLWPDKRLSSAASDAWSPSYTATSS
jgi:hypothetical protein